MQKINGNPLEIQAPPNVFHVTSVVILH